MKDISSLKNLPHYPVMLKEVLEICNPEKGGLFVDCTYGAGGYSNSILSFPKTKVIAIDRDPETKKYADITKENYKDRFRFHNLKFSELKKAIDKNVKVDFIIFDLGISSLQILNLDRGFSFNSEGKPDMRMGLNSISAEDVLNNLDLDTLRDIIKFFGEDKDGLRIATNLIKERKKNPIISTSRFVQIIEKSKKRDFKKKINLSTKSFQAIRIFVNKEITELIEGLAGATEFLKTGGKIITISFHSIEDKIIKFFLSNFSKNKSRGSRYYPDDNKNIALFENYKNKIIKPTKIELEANNRSRSAKLRFATRSSENFLYPHDLKKKFIHLLNLERKYV